MNRQIKGLLYYYITDAKYSFKIFWSILLGILVISLVIAYFMLNVEDGLFTFGFPFGTYFNMGFLGFLTVKESIPFALKIGAVRKNIYLSTAIFFLGYALFFAILSSTIQSIVAYFADVANLHTFMFLHPAQLLGEDTWLMRIIVDTAVMTLILAFMYLVGLLIYRGGILTGGIFFGIIALALLLSLAQGWLFEYAIHLYHTIDLLFFMQLFGIGVLLYGICYFFIRKITTVKIR